MTRKLNIVDSLLSIQTNGNQSSFTLSQRNKIACLYNVHT